MNSKSFLKISAFVITIFLSVCFFSCSSNIEETGEVSFSFTQPMLNKIFSREVGSEKDGYGSISSGLPYGMTNVKAYYVGYDFAGTGQSSVVLYIFTDSDSTYAMYDLTQMSAIASNPGSIDFTNPDFKNNPLSIYEDAILSKGTWKEESAKLILTEKVYRYRNSDSKELFGADNDRILSTFNIDDKKINVISQSGLSLELTSMSELLGDINYGDEADVVPRIKVTLKAGGRTYEKDIEIVEVAFAAIGMGRTVEASDAGPVSEDDKEAYYILFAYSNGNYVIQKLDMENRKLLSILSEGTWRFIEENMISIMENGADEPKEIFFNEKEGFRIETSGKSIYFSEEYADKEFLYNFKYLPVPVSFKNLRVGVKGKVSAEIYAQIPHYGKEVIASGESDSFIIEENTAVTVKMKMTQAYEPEQEPGEFVPDTQMAFYNYDYFSDNGNYAFYFSDNVLTTKPDAPDLGIKLNYGPNRNPCYCFDNDGKMYALSCVYNSELLTKIVTIDNTDGYNISMLELNEEVNSICFDRKTNNLFIYSMLDNDGYVYSCEKESLSTMSSTAKKYKLSAELSDTDLSDFDLRNVKVFTVFNNILYIPYCYVTGTYSAYITLFTADLSEAVFDEIKNIYNLTLTDDNIQKHTLFYSMSEVYPHISDMIYQDENLYILISDIYINDSWNDNSDPFRSRGAVVRINPFTNQIEKIGWTNEELDVSSAGSYLKTSSNWDDFCYSDKSQTNLFVMNGTKPFDVYNTSVLISSKYPSIYVPKVDNGLSTDAFYGPQKFIAIKPKKLVIADDGFAFYTNEDGALSYRNVNRVVIVDLEKFAIETCAEVPVKFAGGASSDFNGDYSRNLERELNGISDNFYYSIQEEEVIYDKTGSNIENFTSYTRIAIKCSDSD